MKLLLCRLCSDVFKLGFKPKSCDCGAVNGKYLKDGLNAEVWGKEEALIPLGLHNPELVEAIRNQPESGMGEEFTAFVIPKQCPTIKVVPSPKKRVKRAKLSS